MKIADYLGLSLTPENAAKIAKECGISNVKERMKNHQLSFMFRKGILFHYFYSGLIQPKKLMQSKTKQTVSQISLDLFHR